MKYKTSVKLNIGQLSLAIIASFALSIAAFPYICGSVSSRYALEAKQDIGAETVQAGGIAPSVTQKDEADYIELLKRDILPGRSYGIVAYTNMAVSYNSIAAQIPPKMLAANHLPRYVTERYRK